MRLLLQCGHHTRPACGVDDTKEDVDEIEICDVMDPSRVAEPEQVIRQGCQQEPCGKVVAQIHPLTKLLFNLGFYLSTDYMTIRREGLII